MTAAASGATILALGSFPGSSAAACLRLSGERAIEALAALAPGEGAQLRGLAGWRSMPLLLRTRSWAARAWASVFRAPRSYTGEDLVEVHVPGNPSLLSIVARGLIEAGGGELRWAQPGEFTLRAFLGGKIDLSQAEAVAALVHASSEAEAQAAQRGLRGDLRRELDAIAARVLEALAFIEACLDFPDEDLGAFPLEPVQARIAAAHRSALAAREASVERLPAVGTLRVVLAGFPNAGKSSLLNAILGRRAALASGIPGTTRDPVRGLSSHRQRRVEWIDVAGTFDPAFQIFGGAEPGEEPIWDIVRRITQAEIAAADVVAWVFDASVDAAAALAAFDALEAPRKLLVAQKCDLLEPAAVDRLAAGTPRAIAVSAVTGRGLEALVAAAVSAADESPADAPVIARFVLSAHQSARLSILVEALERALAAVRGGALELAAADLRDGQDALSSLTGAVSREAVLDLVFSRFCLGK